MEPVTLTAIATAIVTIFFTKVLEKPGENLGQLLWDKTQDLIKELNPQSTELKALLEGSQQQPIDIGPAVLELKNVADENPKLAQAILEVEAAAKNEPNTQLQQQLQQIHSVAAQPGEEQPTFENLSKLAKKIGQVVLSQIELSGDLKAKDISQKATRSGSVNQEMLKEIKATNIDLGNLKQEA